jgi:hypothetical protein
MREPRRGGEGALARLLPERMVTIETTGAHHVARLTPRIQAAALAAAMALGGWTVAATGMVALSALDSAAGRVETEAALLTRAERIEREAADAAPPRPPGPNPAPNPALASPRRQPRLRLLD